MKRRSKSACLVATSTLGGHDARRPRPAAHCGFCAADDLLPKRARNARGRITDAEVVTLCVAQAVLGISSDRLFLRTAKRQLAGLFSVLASQDVLWKRRARLAELIEQLMAAFAQDCPGFHDRIVLLDLTPVKCGCSVETARRSQLGPACAHHYNPQPLALVVGDATAPAGHARTARSARSSSPRPTSKNATSRGGCWR